MASSRQSLSTLVRGMIEFFNNQAGRRDRKAGRSLAGWEWDGFVAVLAWIACLVWPLPAQTQVLGEEAEMERLQSKAEEAIANGDADGAAMNSGKAALMASQLALRRPGQASGLFYRGAESLFRAQEHTYRALALFQRAGGQLPASSGVCSTMTLAGTAVEKSVGLLTEASAAETDQGRLQQARRLQAIAMDWVKTVEGMNGDFQCR